MSYINTCLNLSSNFGSLHLITKHQQTILGAFMLEIQHLFNDILSESRTYIDTVLMPYL